MKSRKRIIKLAILFFCLVFMLSSTGFGEEFLHWGFNENKEIKIEYGVEMPELFTQESVTDTPFRIYGLSKYVPGVKGSALKFDGFSSYVEGLPHVEEDQEKEKEEDEEPAFQMPMNISVEAWISMGAYPWNWAPILTIGNYKITGFYFGVDSRGRLGFCMSDDTSIWHECISELDSKTMLGMDIQKWYHVVGTYSTSKGIAIYINGQLAGTYNNFPMVKTEMFDGIRYGYRSLEETGFRIGRNSVDLAPSDPIRPWATYPSPYTFDGIIDELKVHDKALSLKEVKVIYESVKPENKSQFAPRRFPTVKPSGRFAANYARLKFYPEWDALWPVGDYMDVVVQFDELPTKVMFWRGTRYSPCLVSENGKWMADQSREDVTNWHLEQGSNDDLPTGCIEHMSDTQCRSSRVAIIENNDARVVINWRYLQMDVKFRQIDVPLGTGFGQWGNELYYIYPDGVVVRKVLPGYGHWEETIFLNEPGTRPEDNVELEAITLVNMDGQSKTYSWEHGYPEYVKDEHGFPRFDLKGAVIQMTNFKSKFKPYMIFREKGVFCVFNLEIRPQYSHFPWWNHWPVAQTYSDGRCANASDRTSHSSIGWGISGGEAAIYGMTDKPATSLVGLAKSWNRPPKMKVKGNAASQGYDYTQRAYILNIKKQGSKLDLEFEASEEKPLVNLTIVANNWGVRPVSLKLNGKAVPKGKDFRYGIEYDAEGNGTLIVFSKIKAKDTTNVALLPMG